MSGIDKQRFLDEYKLQDVYKDSIIGWDIIEKIVSNYQHIRMADMDEIRKELECQLQKEFQGIVHSVDSRLKNPEHLAEKIIRKICIEDSNKYKEINIDNYHTIVRDLIGVRILVLAKEEWEQVHNKLCSMFVMNPNEANAFGYMAEPPCAYIRYGDRDVFGNKIQTDYTNKGYRSQHYIVYFQGYYCEIQVRTISEEVFGEFDHRVRYPYRSSNNFLKRYTNTISQITSMVDEMVSTCLQMEGDMWDSCADYFKNDHYETFERTARPVKIGQNTSKTDLPRDIEQVIQNKILRKEER